MQIPRLWRGSSPFWNGADDPGSERGAGLAGEGHVDMRKGFPGLSLIVQETLKRDPNDGHLFVIRGRRGDLIKVIWHDGQGACLFTKRLERGRFIWPSPADGTVTIWPAQLGYLLERIDWLHSQRTWRPSAVG
ncbi:transposase ORF2-like protein [Aurantimonas manganoxydans SI85-9A1]|uniref:Transposase ORF2-like protein n=1 Tax=Aurantimonas manganoxydans (strain ATCC BAA-1229 / DSM 21871 / SI85-9A1) TaxID=287752 RepID=Q1YMA1_AURMS|nr:transposase ORF2-like protein [Aurantimonas manganoxydans SI85-9A1]